MKNPDYNDTANIVEMIFSKNINNNLKKNVSTGTDFNGNTTESKEIFHKDTNDSTHGKSTTRYLKNPDYNDSTNIVEMIFSKNINNNFKKMYLQVLILMGTPRKVKKFFTRTRTIQLTVNQPHVT